MAMSHMIPLEFLSGFFCACGSSSTPTRESEEFASPSAFVSGEEPLVEILALQGEAVCGPGAPGEHLYAMPLSYRIERGQVRHIIPRGHCGSAGITRTHKLQSAEEAALRKALSHFKLGVDPRPGCYGGGADCEIQILGTVAPKAHRVGGNECGDATIVTAASFAAVAKILRSMSFP